MEQFKIDGRRVGRILDGGSADDTLPPFCDDTIAGY